MTDWERELAWGLIKSFEKYNMIVPCQMTKEGKFVIKNEKYLDEVLNDIH